MKEVFPQHRQALLIHPMVTVVEGDHDGTARKQLPLAPAIPLLRWAQRPIPVLMQPGDAASERSRREGDDGRSVIERMKVRMGERQPWW